MISNDNVEKAMKMEIITTKHLQELMTAFYGSKDTIEISNIPYFIINAQIYLGILSAKIIKSLQDTLAKKDHERFAVNFSLEIVERTLYLLNIVHQTEKEDQVPIH